MGNLSAAVIIVPILVLPPSSPRAAEQSFDDTSGPRWMAIITCQAPLSISMETALNALITILMILMIGWGVLLDPCRFVSKNCRVAACGILKLSFTSRNVPAYQTGWLLPKNFGLHVQMYSDHHELYFAERRYFHRMLGVFSNVF